MGKEYKAVYADNLISTAALELKLNTLADKGWVFKGASNSNLILEREKSESGSYDQPGGKEQARETIAGNA